MIDALRFDTLSDPESRAALFPTLHRLVEAGHVAKLTTNAQATQFVMPALFSQTFPLDFGGYNDGIRQRPASYVEVFRDAGYDTRLYSACNQLGAGMGYERGFDRRGTAMDYRLLIEHRISRFLQYYLHDLDTGKRGEDEVVSLIQDDLAGLLEQILSNFENDDKSAWPVPLQRINGKVIRGAALEIELIAREPLKVLEKLRRCSAGIYWRFLGLEMPGRARLFFYRAIEAVRWRSAKWLSRRRFPPFLILGHIEAVAAEILNPVIAFVETSERSTPWLMHIHLMDVHDSRAINRFGNFLVRLKYMPRWFRGRLSGHTRRHWIYDTSLMYLDAKLKRLVDTLDHSGQLSKTCIVITGDHGNSFALSPRRKGSIAGRTYREDIEVPIVVHAPWRQDAIGAGQHDSMSVSATLMDCLDLPAHPSFRGKSVFESGKSAVISESCGSGNADVAVRDLHFTVTGARYKAMVRLIGALLEVTKIFDLQQDPDELNNLSGQPGHETEIEALLAALFEQRCELLDLRGVNADPTTVPRAAA